MTLKGIWKGESIYPGEINKEGPDTSESIILVITHFTSLGEIRGNLNFDPEQSGIEESAEIIGEVKVNQISFVQMLPDFYYMEDGVLSVVKKTPNPDVLFEGRLINDDYLVGTWIVHKTYRLVNDKVLVINERKGNWWLKKIRGT